MVPNVSLFYLAILAFTAILWFIPILSIMSFLIGVIARLCGVSVFHTRQAITTTLWWPYVALNGSLATLGAWWSLSWW